MKLIMKIKTIDDKIVKYECTDFPYIQGDFFVMPVKDFKREYIRCSSIASASQYFEK